MTKDERVIIRVSEEEKARWKKAAGAKSVSEWVRDLVEEKLNPPAIWVRENANYKIENDITTTSGIPLAPATTFKFKPDPKPTTQKKSRGR